MYYVGVGVPTMGFQDPREGFCWDHGFYAAFACPRCSKGGLFNGNSVEINESETERETPVVSQMKEKQLAHGC